MKITAAVARTKGAPLTIESVEIDEPREDEVLVRVVATGVCHTDMVMRDQLLPIPLPAVLGHEGAGIVERVGKSVTKVRPGDHVVMTFDSCGACPSCAEHEPAYCHAIVPLNFVAGRADGSTGLSKGAEAIHSHVFGQSSFATHALCHVRNVVKVPDTLPLEKLGPLACGVQTGAGTVLNALKVRKGKSVAVFGSGTVGLSAVMAAKYAGAAPIVAVDLVDSRLAMAREFGATHTINARDADVAKEIMAATGAGLDYAIDTTGVPEVIGQAVSCLAPRGSCAVVGAVKPGALLPIDGSQLMSLGRSVRGVVEGSSDPDVFIPKLIEMYLEGHLPYDKMIGYYPFSAINEAIADSENGKCIKPILRMDQA